MSSNLSLKTLREAVAGSGAAIRRITEYQPAGGAGDKIFPPTYEGGEYATEKRLIDGETVDCVLLDSVQSQANRMEEALLDAWEDQLIKLPVITVDFSGTEVSTVGRITSLETPHRVADAILRDSFHDGKPFRQSEIGKRLDDVNTRNATALFELCPTALIFGMWDSAGPKGGMGAKFQRAMVSEIVGIDATFGVKTSSRVDPLGIMRQAGPVYKSKTGGWTLNEEEARKEKDASVKYGKDGKPSEINHGNVTPSISPGGVTIRRGLQTTVLSLPALRRLRFPINGEKGSREIDVAAQTVLASLALCAATLSCEQGCDLRSRCLLVPTGDLSWELINRPGEESLSFSLTADEAIGIFKQAVEDAREKGLPWHDDEIQLKPSDKLVTLVKRSHELLAEMVEEEV